MLWFIQAIIEPQLAMWWKLPLYNSLRRWSQALQPLALLLFVPTGCLFSTSSSSPLLISTSLLSCLCYLGLSMSSVLKSWRGTSVPTRRPWTNCAGNMRNSRMKSSELILVSALFSDPLKPGFRARVCVCATANEFVWGMRVCGGGI